MHDCQQITLLLSTYFPHLIQPILPSRSFTNKFNSLSFYGDSVNIHKNNTYATVTTGQQNSKIIFFTLQLQLPPKERIITDDSYQLQIQVASGF